MIIKFTVLACIALELMVSASFAQQADGHVVDTVRNWLAISDAERGDLLEQSFADKPLSKSDADLVAKLLWDDYVKRERELRKLEWDDKVIKMGDLTMKFEYKVFGKRPESGRSLFISMHGGGGAPAEVNEQQWRNQIRLYEPEEGVYLAPRAPTDTWNLWHQAHIDQFFARIIQDAILFEDVNPDRVYIMGYSAGGDGVYQLAPRMADSLAAAAMMAGHPNDASPLGLRNIGFTLHMGGKDSAYNRNEVAREWKRKLAELQSADPDGYRHEVVIHEEFSHWMNREDAVAVPWMAKFTRDPNPTKIVWRQSSVTHEDYYWLRFDPVDQTAGTEVVASRDGQSIRIDSGNGPKSMILQLNDELFDLDQPVQVTVNGNAIAPMNATRTAAVIHRAIEAHGDPRRIYCAELIVPISSSETQSDQK
jgi:predicted esterase